MKYLSPEELKEILIASVNQENKQIYLQDCNQEINDVQLNYNEKLNNIINQKPIKNSFIKMFLRKVF